MDRGGKGDIIVHVNIWTPKNLTKQEKDALELLRNSENFRPDPGKSERSFFDKMKDYFH